VTEEMIGAYQIEFGISVMMGGSIVYYLIRPVEQGQKTLLIKEEAADGFEGTSEETEVNSEIFGRLLRVIIKLDNNLERCKIEGWENNVQEEFDESGGIQWYLSVCDREGNNLILIEGTNPEDKPFITVSEQVEAVCSELSGIREFLNE